MTNDKLARIDEKLDRSTLAVVPFNRSSIAISTMGEAMEMAKLMSLSRQAVRAPFRGEPGICLALVIQAHEWGLNPYAAASKAYVVNDQIAWESQLIHAVIESRAPLKGRLKCSYTGVGAERKCIVSGTFTDGEVREYESPMIKDIRVKNSPLWRNDPDQQLWYYSSRSWCRKWCADVLLGIYAPDELDFSRGAKDVTRDQTVDFNPLGPTDSIEENIKIVEREETLSEIAADILKEGENMRRRDEQAERAQKERTASKVIADRFPSESQEALRASGRETLTRENYEATRAQAEEAGLRAQDEALEQARLRQEATDRACAQAAKAETKITQTVADQQQEREDPAWPGPEPSGARGKPASEPKSSGATKTAPKAEIAQAASVRDPDPIHLSGYYQQALAFIATATVEGALANWWKGQRSARLSVGMTAKEMQNLTDTYWAKHIALSEGE